MSEAEKQEEKQDAKPLDKMTVVELRVAAKEEIPGITGVSGMKKDQLLQALKEARNTEEKAPAPKKQKKAAGPRKAMTLKELKEEIARLRAEQEALRQEKDRAKLAIIRRRINRLKKKTRKAA